MRINIWVPDESLPKIDEKRKKLGMSRSSYLVYCALNEESPKTPHSNAAEAVGYKKKGKWIFSKIAGKRIFVEDEEVEKK